MNNSNFLIIKGGDSSEKDVSLKTAGCVEEAFCRLGLKYKVLTIGSAFDLVNLSLNDVDYIFNAMHGGDGENGIVQGLLDMSGLPYNGAGREASTICMSKILTRYVASAHSVLIPKGVVSTRGSNSYPDVKSFLGERLVLKPDCQGCSIGISVVSDAAGFERAVLDSGKYQGKLLFEEFICGSEITVAILDGKILPYLSIIHSHEFFDFDAKFKSKDTRYELAKNIPASTVGLIEGSIEKMSRALDLGRYARFDFIVRDGVPYLLEINTLPGLNSKSVFVKACLLSGIDYDEMIRRIIGNSDQLTCVEVVDERR